MKAKAKVNKEELREAVSRINKIMKKSNLFDSKIILLEGKDGCIYLTGVQYVVSMKTRIDDVVLNEPFSCLFDGNMVMALLSKMTAKDIILEYDTKNSDLYLSSAGSKARVKIRCEDPKRFAGWKTMNEPEFKKETDVLFQKISECKHALPVKNTNPVMSSFCLQYGEGNWKITAVDGFRVSVRGEVKSIENTILVPGDTATILESIFMDKKVTIFTEGEDMWLQDDRTSVYLRTVSGKFFDIRNIINAEYPYRLMIDRDELVNALTLANVALLKEQPEGKKGVFCFDGKMNELRIRTKDSIGNEMDSSIAISGNLNKELVLGMNIRYVLDAVKNVPDKVISMELKSEVTPIKISGKGYTEIVLPIKLRS